MSQDERFVKTFGSAQSVVGYVTEGEGDKATRKVKATVRLTVGDSVLTPMVRQESSVLAWLQKNAPKAASDFERAMEDANDGFKALTGGQERLKPGAERQDSTTVAGDWSALVPRDGKGRK